MKRRKFIRKAIAAGSIAGISSNLLSACRSPQNMTNSATAKLGKIKLGIIPLTDCASVVMAHELNLFAKNGVDVEISKEASWANVRDKLLTGDLQGSHCLFGMPFSVYTGIGGVVGKEMHIAMVLNNNGQAITLTKDLCGQVGFKEVDKVAAAIQALKANKKEKPITFAMTFPGGTHDMWLRYWLAAAKINSHSVNIITVPPPQMVANMKVGNMDGYCVGEPWGGVAVQQGIGFTHISTQDIWKHHPEKALVFNKEFSEQRRDEAKAVIKAILEASIWLDDRSNLKRAASIIGKQSYVNAPPEIIEERLLGHYDLGCTLGEHTYTEDTMLFHNKGLVNFPRKAHGIWYMAQYVRFGYLTKAPDYKAIADKLILHDVYKEVATGMGIPLPDDDMKPFTINIDNATFDPTDPTKSLQLYEGAKA
jgi:nitrate/nitrite transport system substrate-binding protein